MGQCLGSLSIQCSGWGPVVGAPPPPPSSHALPGPRLPVTFLQALPATGSVRGGRGMVVAVKRPSLT